MLTQTNILNIINNKKFKIYDIFGYYDKIKLKINFLISSTHIEKMAYVYGLSYLKILYDKKYIHEDNICDYIIYCIILANKYISDDIISVLYICEKCEISFNNYKKNEFSIIKNLDYNLNVLDYNILSKISKLVNVGK